MGKALEKPSPFTAQEPFLEGFPQEPRIMFELSQVEASRCTPLKQMPNREVVRSTLPALKPATCTFSIVAHKNRQFQLNRMTKLSRTKSEDLLIK